MNFEPNERIKDRLAFEKEIKKRPNVTYVKTYDVEPNPNNQIIYEDFKGTKEFRMLCESVASEGILQPLYVVPHPRQYSKYVLVAGHRRLEAAKQCGIEEIPVIIGNIDNLSDVDIQISLITTNLLVRNRSAGEKAKEVENLEELFKEKRKQNPDAFKGIKLRTMLAETTGISERTIADYQQINKKLPEEEKEKFHAGEIPLTEAIEKVKPPIKEQSKQQPKKESHQFTDEELKDYFQFLEDLFDEEKQIEITKYIKSIVMKRKS